MPTDSTAVVINETAEKMLGFKNPINQLIYYPQDSKALVLKPYHIIGVMKDFNFQSLKSNISPLMLFMGNDEGGLSIRADAANIPALLNQIKSKWTAFSPNQQFSYTFMNQNFDAIYRTEQRTGTIFIAFTSLAIIIACLGLFGLAAYAAEQRTKEIGIRKVLGASMSTIVQMLSKDFITLVVIAIIIASPLAWWAMNKWLQDFAYRIHIQWWILAVAGSGAILIAFVTISFQSIKAALTNPVKSLRSE
jgi:putative ABC transport system permease protein